METPSKMRLDDGKLLRALIGVGNVPGRLSTVEDAQGLSDRPKEGRIAPAQLFIRGLRD
jgi:hypothetical protein